MTAPQSWFVFRFNHFDPTWRRCWDRDFYDAGRRFRSYRAIEESWITDALASCADGVSCFMVECSWVLRHYLERHPAEVETLRRLAHEKRFELLGSGETIADANLIHGETLARNLLLGTLWAEDTLGVRPTTGFHSDGFGSSAQLPQLFRQCGFEWIAEMSYVRPDRPFWCGLDGSVIYVDTENRVVHRHGFSGSCCRKLAPCPVCQGEGCAACSERGFVVGERAELNDPPTERTAGPVGAVRLWGEELQPGFHVAEAIARYNAASTEISLQQGTFCHLRPYIADRLAQLDAPPAELISSRVENNPAHTGCYLSRIAMKQQHRRSEHALLAAECWDILLADGKQADALRDAWRQMALAAFHDSITSSHCDPAYQELLDLHAEVQQTAEATVAAACASVLIPQPGAVTLFNHQAFSATVPVTVHVPGHWENATAEELPVFAVTPGADTTEVTFLACDIPPLGARTVTLRNAPAKSVSPVTDQFSIGDYTLEIGEHGITRIDHAAWGRVTDTTNTLFGELLLEHDDGDPWATRSLDRTRERLSPYTRLKEVARSAHELAITYTGRHPASDDPHQCDDPHVTTLCWEQTFRLRAGVPWLAVDTRVDWYTHSRRLRLAFPSVTREDRGVYEIPYGVLERDRYEATSTFGGNAGGDWPAIHWAGIQTPEYTFAVFNQGTPSYRIEDGTVLVSVLRSPQLPYGLFEPEYYVAYNYDGMRDHGTHVFSHALYLGAGDWQENATIRQAALFNSGLTIQPGTLNASLPEWKIEAGHTQLTAVKMAEDRRGMVLRFAESAGRPDCVRITPPAAFLRAQLANLLEDAGETLPVENGAFSFSIAPWKVMTIRLD